MGTPPDHRHRVVCLKYRDGGTPSTGRAARSGRDHPGRIRFDTRSDCTVDARSQEGDTYTDLSIPYNKVEQNLDPEHIERNNKMAIDPVCKMQVDPETASAKSEYKGETYYFCAPGCKADFDKDPERYLKSAPSGDQHHHHGH